MKKPILLILLFSTFSQAQFYEITYETNVQTFYTEKGKKVLEDWADDPKEYELLLELNMNPPKEKFKFIYNNSVSKVFYQTKLKNEQVVKEIEVKKIPSNIVGDITSDYKNNQFSYEMDVYGKKYLVKDQLIQVDLKDTGNKKDIIGFEANEAVAKLGDIDIIIWYTKEIPFNFTPDIYYTTKGFVLELHYKTRSDESEVINSWQAIDKKKLSKEPKISIPNKGKIIKKDEVNKVWDEANERMNALYSQDD